jgi:hypothetical protein
MDKNSGPAWGAARPNWGTHGDRILRDISFGTTIPSVPLRHTPDPVAFGLAPGPATGVTTSEPDLGLTTTGVTKIIPLSIRLWRPDDRVQTN